MKNLIFSFITLLIFLHTATQAQEKADVVVDWDGNALQLGENYYVVPIVPRNVLASGLLPYPVSKENCTYGVSQTLHGVGEPVRFSLIAVPYNLGLEVRENFDLDIRENFDLDISFSASVGCGLSNSWKRGDYDNATEQYFVMIGKEPSEWPAIGIIGDAFQIRKYGVRGTYEFVFCPQTCFSCPRKCHRVGISVQGGVRRLVVSSTDDTVFPISFRKYLPDLAMY